MRYLVPALLFLASCATAPPGERKLQIAVRNNSDRPLEFRARSGLFGRTITLEPGHTWKGWVLRDFVGEEIRVEVAETEEK